MCLWWIIGTIVVALLLVGAAWKAGYHLGYADGYTDNHMEGYDYEQRH